MSQPDTVPMRILRAEIGEELAQLLEGRSRSKLDAGAGVVGLETQSCADLIRKTTAVHPDTDPMTTTAAQQPIARNEPERTGPWGTTYTGRRYYPADPRPQDIDILDIAHSLAMQCRFGGHCREHYSIAQHSVLVSLCCDAKDALWGLLHDASEAYIVDVPVPAKIALGDAYARLERQVMAAVCVRFGLPAEMPASVHRVDHQILAAEAHQLMPAESVREWTLIHKPLPIDVIPWGPETAKRMFLKRFAELYA